MKKYHYVYRITDVKNNKHYYGKRSTDVDPEKDLGVCYFSSSTNKAFRNDQRCNPDYYKYKVIKVYSSAKKALLMECKLHEKFNVGVNPMFYNKVKQTSTKFDTSGVTLTLEHKNKISQSLIGRPPVNKGKACSEETKAKLSALKKGKPSNRKGCTLKEEQKKKLSKALKKNTNSLNVKHCKATKKKLSKATSGSKNPKAKKANIYCYITNKILAKEVVLKVWCRENNYDQGNLSKTTKADRNKPHCCKNNVHQHKKIYAVYV